MSQNKAQTEAPIDLSTDEIRLIQKLRVMKKAGRGGPPPMLLIRCVANHLQIFNAVPAGLMPIDTNARPE
jgi:hypothetical protein